MQYKKVTFMIGGGSAREILIARLSGIGYEGFEETQDALITYIPETEYNNDALVQIVEGDIEFSTEAIPQQNWNSQWEENFHPVIVPGFCTIRADFHQLDVDTPYQITITPKMSFGTGHHATTQLMMTQMQGLDFKGKSVLDFGTGTGILAILARLLGAQNVLAIDNDEWSYLNALENVARNNSTSIEVQQSSLDSITGCFDIILANINRNILLQYMHTFPALLQPKGAILMSGLLVEDTKIILPAAAREGLKLNSEQEMDGWIALLFTKS